MLVLRRKPGESVLIGDGIEVQILGVEGDTVKLGFSAPPDIQILRKELVESILQENLEAGKRPPNQEQLRRLLDTFPKLDSKQERV
jgi:carbon storage regulator